MTCKWFPNYLTGKSFTNTTGNNHFYRELQQFAIKFDFSQQNKSN